MVFLWVEFVLNGGGRASPSSNLPFFISIGFLRYNKGTSQKKNSYFFTENFSLGGGGGVEHNLLKNMKTVN